MLHGTARGEIQLPTAQRIAGLLSGKLESVAVAPDVPGAEMPPITSVAVSAKRENNSCRVTADCTGSESAVDDQSRCAIWQG
jgi:hypothetical protein